MGFKPRKTTKNNKYDNLSKPQDSFDFHNLGILSPRDITKLADDFLYKCRQRSLTKILFITGKGLHSRNGSPVVKPVLRKHLEKLSYVVRVYESRRDRGGQGALEVTLDFD
jgi:DNA-nicking Smr family endonuclease